MDLSILGVSLSEYKHYAQAVRQEYIHVTNDAYQSGRTTILEDLLRHPRLYLTDYYYDRLEEQARQNVQHEINSLSAS